MEMYIVLAITLFMMISFVWHKVPFGVTTMTCCLLLAIFGIVDIQTAFSGFGNKIVVLIAPMLALSAVLTKTSLVMKISSILNTMKDQRGMLLIVSFFLVGAVFAQFIPSTAALTILVVFIMTTFLSNMATQTVLIPIAASVALAAGWDPRGLVLIIGTANMFAVGFPSGSGECAVCFAAGGYNPVKVLKFTVPYMLLAIVSCALSAQLLFPLQG